MGKAVVPIITRVAVGVILFCTRFPAVCEGIKGFIEGFIQGFGEFSIPPEEFPTPGGLAGELAGEKIGEKVRGFCRFIFDGGGKDNA